MQPGHAVLPTGACLLLQVYSVYFHMATDATAIPLECSAVREPWRDASQGADASPSSVQLARRVMAIGA